MKTNKTVSVAWPIAYLLCACLLLPGCATTSKIQQVSAEAVKPAPRTKPVDSMVECSKPGKLEDGSFGAVVRKLSEVIGLLDDCASKQKHLADWIQDDK